jgi:hypothetical protein
MIKILLWMAACLVLVSGCPDTPEPPPDPKYPVDTFDLPDHPKRTTFNQRVARLADSIEVYQTSFLQAEKRYFQGLWSWSADTIDLDDNYEGLPIPFNQLLETDGYSWEDFGVDTTKLAALFAPVERVCPILVINFWSSSSAQGYEAQLWIKVLGDVYRRSMTRRIFRSSCVEEPVVFGVWEIVPPQEPLP